MIATKTSREKIKKPVKSIRKSQTKKDIGESYNKFKNYNGQQYTGMQIGHSHKWYYDKGEWHDRKITPDKWEITYAVTKRRAGKAPKGSGAAVGTGYHWFILSHQFVHKLNADDYSTAMIGLKFKLAHKRAGKNTWSVSEPAKRKHLVEILKKFIQQIEKEPQAIETIPLEFEYKNKEYKGMAVPMPGTCSNGVCKDLDIILNDQHMGLIRCTEKGWRMTHLKPQSLVDTIGELIMSWYG